MDKPARTSKIIIGVKKIKTSGFLKIGQLARQTRETVPTIRFWTDQGLIPVKAFSKGGYQLYTSGTIAKVRWIRKLQQKRLTIQEIVRLAGHKSFIPSPLATRKIITAPKIKNTGLLRIGQVAQQAGETISTIRFWTDKKLLPVKAYSKGGYQLYEQRTVAKARRIRKLQQEKRMTVGEIREAIGSE